MRTSRIPPEESAGLAEVEQLRRMVTDACARPPNDEPRVAALSDEERSRMEEALRTVEETVTALTLERDALVARVAELEHLGRVGAAQVAAAMVDRDRLAKEQDRLEDERTRARTKAGAAAAERDQARQALEAMTGRAIAAETRAAVAEAVAAERLERIEDLRSAIESMLQAGTPLPNGARDGRESSS